MRESIISTSDLNDFRSYLKQEEKSPATVEKYMRDLKHFLNYAKHTPISKELTIAYKQHLLEHQYAQSSINSMLASLNRLLTFLGFSDLRVRSLRCQRQVYSLADRELTKSDYLRLLKAAAGQERLWLILQTICATGIRVSELRYFTVEAVRRGELSVRCKSKTRTILLPSKLKKLLLKYAVRRQIHGGAIFITRSGRPLDRSNIWSQMKRLCAAAGVAPSKVFPHNLRKLFARTFHSMEKDIAKLADILGHSCIETTRIYIMTTSQEHRKKLERLNLLL